MKRAILSLLLASAAQLAVADPASCTPNWNVTIAGGTTTYGWGDADEYCVNAMLATQASGATWRGGCYATHYAATHAIEFNATTYEASSVRVGCSAADTEDFTFNWRDQSHVMQGLLICACVVVFLMGYNAGDKV